MLKPRVFVTRKLPEAGLRLLRDACQVEVWPDELPPPRMELLSRAPGLAGILSLITDHMDAEFMDTAPHLRVISNYAVGVDNVDVAAATQRRIVVGNTPGVLAETTADLAFALLLATARQLPQGVDFIRAGKWRTWNPLDLLGPDVHHATLGIVGLGSIGCAMARRARGFDMRVIYSAPHRSSEKEREYGVEYRHLDDLLREADFVSLHLPLSAETHHLIDARALGLMKASAILINTARGPVVDADALYEALASHRIWAAGLDVTEPEPLPRDHRLLALDNCVVVPHLGSASFATRDRMAVLAAENLLAGLAGRPLPSSPNQREIGRAADG